MALFAFSEAEKLEIPGREVPGPEVHSQITIKSMILLASSEYHNARDLQ